jgi:hypothetical protein
MHVAFGPPSVGTDQLAFGTPLSHPAAGKYIVVSIEISFGSSTEEELVGAQRMIVAKTNPDLMTLPLQRDLFFTIPET